MGDEYAKKEFNRVMEELTIMNLFLIPPIHMFVIIP